MSGFPKQVRLNTPSAQSGYVRPNAAPKTSVQIPAINMNDQNIEQHEQHSPACEGWIDGLFVQMFRLMHTFEKDFFTSPLWL